MDLSERDGAKARLDEALAAYGAALAVLEQAGVAPYAEIARKGLDRAGALLQERHASGAGPTLGDSR